MFSAPVIAFIFTSCRFRPRLSHRDPDQDDLRSPAGGTQVAPALPASAVGSVDTENPHSTTVPSDGLIQARRRQNDSLVHGQGIDDQYRKSAPALKCPNRPGRGHDSPTEVGHELAAGSSVGRS